ncbi:tetratricopeptide (TPR) repeat protein [Sphingomonas sp. F9_3S_D5_B_2]
MNERGLQAFPALAAAAVELDRGHFDVAAAQVIQHLRDNPDEPRGTALLGMIAVKTGALVQAEQFLRRALALGLQTIEVQRELSSALYQQERLADALNAFSYLQERTTDPQIAATRAMILHKLDRNADAIAAHEALLQRTSDVAQYWIAYGHSLRAAGRTEDAVAAYREAIGVDSECGEAWWSIASIKSKVLSDADIVAMDEALGIAIDARNIVPLHFALGRAWHDRGDFARAFQHYSEANELRSSELNYDPRELSDEVTEFIRVFASTADRPAPAAEPTGPVPVFVISMPRSGSTLLEQMLDRHERIEAVGELPYVRALVRSVVEIHTRREPIKVPELIGRLSEQEKQALGADYMQRASLHRRTDAPYFIDKMPMNWSDILFIREILPQARFIEIRRNAMDCCFSNYIQFFSRVHASSFDLTHMGSTYRDYARLMDHVSSLSPDFIHHVRYEQLIEEPEQVLRGTLEHLGLDWDEAVLTFYASDRVVRTPSAEQVRRPLNREGVGVWKAYAQWLQPLREALGLLSDA